MNLDLAWWPMCGTSVHRRMAVVFIILTPALCGFLNDSGCFYFTLWNKYKSHCFQKKQTQYNLYICLFIYQGIHFKKLVLLPV